MTFDLIIVLLVSVRDTNARLDETILFSREYFFPGVAGATPASFAARANKFMSRELPALFVLVSVLASRPRSSSIFNVTGSVEETAVIILELFKVLDVS